MKNENENENYEQLINAMEEDPEYREYVDQNTSYEEFVDNSLHIAPEFVGHIESVLQKLPKKDLRELRRRRILLFAPGKSFNGMTLDLAADDEERLLIYLSPDLLDRPVDQIRNTIAHELAHAVLKHSEQPHPNARIVGEVQERQADEMAALWGFPRPAGEEP
jgi:hypothetical protein